MVESSSSGFSDIEVTLGYLSEPKNSLILTPKFLPSKVGGLPVRKTYNFYLTLLT